jgi:hypothetical protein
MPERDLEAGHSSRLLRGLIWTGVVAAPLAAVVVLLGQSSGAVRFAVLLIAVSIVLIGAAVLIRSDPVLHRMHLDERVAEEVRALRSELRAELTTGNPAADQHRPTTPGSDFFRAEPMLPFADPFPHQAALPGQRFRQPALPGQRAATQAALPADHAVAQASHSGPGTFPGHAEGWRPPAAHPNGGRASVPTATAVAAVRPPAQPSPAASPWHDPAPARNGYAPGLSTGGHEPAGGHDSGVVATGYGSGTPAGGHVSGVVATGFEPGMSTHGHRSGVVAGGHPPGAPTGGHGSGVVAGGYETGTSTGSRPSGGHVSGRVAATASVAVASIPQQRGVASAPLPGPPRASATVRPGVHYGRPETLDGDFGASDGYAGATSAPVLNGRSSPVGDGTRGGDHGAASSGDHAAESYYGATENYSPAGGHQPSGGYQQPGAAFGTAGAGGYGANGYGANGYGANGYGANGYGANGYGGNGYDGNGHGAAPGASVGGFDADTYGAAGTNGYHAGHGTGARDYDARPGDGARPGAGATGYGAGLGLGGNGYVGGPAADGYGLVGGYDGAPERDAGDPHYRARRHRPSADDTNVGTAADFAASAGWPPDGRYAQGPGGR